MASNLFWTVRTLIICISILILCVLIVVAIMRTLEGHPEGPADPAASNNELEDRFVEKIMSLPPTDRAELQKIAQQKLKALGKKWPD